MQLIRIIIYFKCSAACTIISCKGDAIHTDKLVSREFCSPLKRKLSINMNADKMENSLLNIKYILNNDQALSGSFMG